MLAKRLEVLGFRFELVGVVGDGAKATYAPVIVKAGKEKEIGVEELLLIENLNGNLILGVARYGYGRAPDLRVAYPSAGRAYARAYGEAPPSSRESFDLSVSVIGEVVFGPDGKPAGVRQNKLIIAPRSRVYAIREGNPLELFGGEENGLIYDVGHYKDRRKWKVPVLKRYIPYHIGVFCVTGWGKTSLVRCKIIPLLRRAGYGVLVFDWKGDDYAPYAAGNGWEVVKLTDVDFGWDEYDVAGAVMNMAGNFGFTPAAVATLGTFEDVLADLVKEFKDAVKEGRKKPEDFKSFLLQKGPGMVEQRSTRYGPENARKFRKHISRLDEGKLALLVAEKNVSVEDILRKAREGVAVVDMGGVETEDKLRGFLAITDPVWESMNVRREKQGFAIVIDEAPQYCPYQPSGLQKETTERIKNLAALGRSYDLPLVLCAQGLAGEIGVNAAVRRNLNTWFVGKVHPLDREEARRLLPHVELEFLQSLEVGHFYFFGNMCPSPEPLLIRFELEEPEKADAGRARGSLDIFAER